MRPRSQGPSDGEGARHEFDAAWNDVLDPSRATPAPSATDEVRAAGDDADADAGPRVAESSAVDLPTATLEQETTLPDEPLGHEAAAARDIDAMMSGSWAMATRDATASIPESPPASASSSSMRGLKESDAEMAAIMGTREPRAKVIVNLASSSSAALPVTPSAELEPESSTASIEDTPELPRPRAERPVTGPAGVVRAAPSRRMSSPEPRRGVGRSAGLELGAKPKRLSLGWAVVAGIGIAGIAWLVGGPIRRPSTSPESKAVVPSGEAPLADRTQPAVRSTTPDGIVPSGITPAAEDAAPLDPPDQPEPPPVVPEVRTRPEASPGRGVRTAPAGTPPDIAATFARLPVSPADLPPVGGIGSSGIHIDRIEMGASYDNKTGCVGVATSFAVAANEEINVCLRVVHPRQDEVMSIVWQKDDGTTARRGKVAVKPIHAYRTRAYLRLRAEYIGAWTVRLVSADGVELASHAFTITK